MHASHIVTMIPPISDFDKDPVLELHRNDILNNIYSTQNLLSDNSGALLGNNESDDDNCSVGGNIVNQKDRVVQNRINENRIDENRINENHTDENIDNNGNNENRENSVNCGLWIGYVSTTGDRSHQNSITVIAIVLTR